MTETTTESSASEKTTPDPTTMVCRVCGNTDHNIHYDVKEMMLGLRSLHGYFECAECGCLQIETVPENIQDFYPSDDYYSYDKIEAGKGLKGFFTKKRDLYAATGKCFLGKVMHRFQPHDKLPSLQYTKVTTDSKILDVGCGAAHLLHSMKEAGFKNLLGIDPFNKEEINYDNGLKVEKKSIHDLSLKDEKGDWDLIMFNHSFEHVLDQHDVLEKAYTLLKPGGICMVRIPTVTSWAWRSYGVDWVQLDAPRHFFLHSIRSMQLLSEDTGFKLEEVIYDSFAFQCWGSVQYQQDIPLHDEKSYAVNPDKSQFKPLDIREFEDQSKQLNETKAGDQAAFYLKKPS